MKIVAFTGAGISKSAGIPTFEEVPHLKDKLSVEYRSAFPDDFNNTLTKLKMSVAGKEPTKAHKILANLKIPIITMNIDGLHTKAGSNQVIEIHGNAEKDNIVLYGENIHNAQECVDFLFKTALEAKEQKDEAILLVIGTSMQTAFANSLVTLAYKLGFKIHEINQNADEELSNFFVDLFDL